MLALLLLLAADKPPEWRVLFDGKKMDAWEACDYANPGKVELKDGAIVMPKGKPMTGVFYKKKDFPTMDYEVEVQAKKVEGRDFFSMITFPVGKEHLSFVPGGWSGNVTGLSVIDFADASMNETTRNIEYEKGKWYAFRVRVTAKRVQAWVDKEKVVDIDTEDRVFTLRAESRECKPFGLASYSTTGAARSVKVRGLTDAEKKEVKKKR
ncbi:MAG: DUF1080 domain-containing protein [Gemmataceae bacterium]|nr:DUF1080 domain-containing protein [Gemmataceae bacterium]